jgi:hypothetical protein
VLSQFLSIIADWIRPKLTVAKKLDNLKKRFANTLTIYDKINKETDWSKVDKNETMREYQALRDSNM